MQLAVVTQGEGHRTAILVHGIMSGAEAWHRVAADLDAAGYRVLAVDLAGHGSSPRAARYSAASWTDDVVETVAPLLDGPPDLVMGHSLGSVVAGEVATRLGARSAIYVDPAFAFPRGVKGAAFKAAFAMAPRPSRRMLARMNPKWSEVDLEIEVSTVARWDRRTIFAFVRTAWLRPPRHRGIPTLVVLAEKSLLITDRARSALVERGMIVLRLGGTGHTVFRDDHGAFMRTITEWLAQVPGPRLRAARA